MGDRMRMSKPPPAQEQSKSQSQEQSRRKEHAASQPAAERAHTHLTTAPQSQPTSGQNPAVQLEHATATAGANDERNIAIRWIDVWIGNAKPVRFVVTTATGNALELGIEQGHYTRSYSGKTTINSDVMPIAPIGTRFMIVARDLTTGELVEQAGVWRNMRTSLLSALLNLLKKWFT